MSRKTQQKETKKQNPDLELQEFIQATNFKSPTQKSFHESILKNDIVFASGPSGVGKTFLAL
jgi:phosphate starvation-inducible protein PhoH